MGEREHHTHGTFSWTDLGTTDQEAATSFYSGLFGWDTTDEPMPGDRGMYTMASLGGRSVAGLFIGPPGMPPAWTSYVAVDDADSVATKAAGLGASVMAGPFDVMEAGRMALIQDPTGAIFAVWQAGERIGAEHVNAHGALTLNQLNTRDVEAASRFYSDLFGWRIEEAPGSDGEYWGIYQGEVLNGGMMPLPEDSPAPAHWLVYFGADDLDAAAATIVAQGGVVIMPRTEVPGGEIVVAQDPQGAVFALFAGRFDD
jgi:uncharacterized protein